MMTCGSTLAQVMACCLMASSHYLEQCWLIINKIQWNSAEGNLTRETTVINHRISFKITYLNFHPNLELRVKEFKVVLLSKASDFMSVLQKRHQRSQQIKALGNYYWFTTNTRNKPILEDLEDTYFTSYSIQQPFPHLKITKDAFSPNNRWSVLQCGSNSSSLFIVCEGNIMANRLVKICFEIDAVAAGITRSIPWWLISWLFT